MKLGRGPGAQRRQGRLRVLTRTYVDSGVLIAAACGGGRLGECALAVLQDSAREFVSSDYIKMKFFRSQSTSGGERKSSSITPISQGFPIWLNFRCVTPSGCLEEACRSGLQSYDAIHIAVAAIGGCDELITTEKPTSAIHRASLIRVCPSIPSREMRQFERYDFRSRTSATRSRISRRSSDGRSRWLLSTSAHFVKFASHRPCRT